MENCNESFRILIVDDSNDTIKLFKNILEKEFCNITYSKSGRDALKKLDSNEYDLILLDIKLPDINGFDLFEKLKEKDTVKNTPVIFISQIKDKKSAKRGLELGGTAYLRKDSADIEILTLIKTQRELKDKNDKLVKEKEISEKLLVKTIQQKEEIEKLLFNVFPPLVAEELKIYGQVRPRHYNKVSVLFADFINFSIITKTLTPGRLLKKLSMYFSEFDKIVEKWDVEKIKTIGDAYMCVGGLRRLNQIDPIQTVLAGLEIQDFIKYHNARNKVNNDCFWELRMGIHTGDVIAGVVGQSKYSYDVWGDTVNIASRLESKSDAGKINISEETYNGVKEFFDCTHRGKIETKHTGVIGMCFVERIKEEYSDDDAGRTPNKRFQSIISDLSQENGFGG